MEMLILRRLDPSKGRFKRCRRRSIEEQMLPQAMTTMRKTMKNKKLDKKGKVKGKF